MLSSTAHPAPKMIAIIKKKAATQIRATAFSCSGLGKVMPIANMIPFVNETKNRMSMARGPNQPHPGG